MEIGLLEPLHSVTFDKNDLAGPYALGEGTLILDLTKQGYRWTGKALTREGWEVFTCGTEPKLGDVSAIREEQRAEKKIPTPPDGAVHFVWVWQVPTERGSSPEFSYKLGKRPEVFRQPIYVPTKWHSVLAFDSDNRILGRFSPHYWNSGWLLADAIQADAGHISLTGTSIPESIGDARDAIK